MKILLVNVVCGIKSTGRICTDIAEELETKGHEVRIAYGRENVPKEYEKYAIRIGNAFVVALHAFRKYIFDGDGEGSKYATIEFVNWIREYDPDIIHLHNIHGCYINYEILFSYLKASGKRVVWTLHDCIAFTGRCAYFDYIGCMRWKDHCGKCIQKERFPRKVLFDRTDIRLRQKKHLYKKMNNLDIVVPSRWLREWVKQSFLSRHRVKVIYNGIDKHVFRPCRSEIKKKYGVEGKKIILGVAAVWSVRKGLDDFINLSNMLTKDYRIILIGLSNSQIRNLPKGIIGISKIENVKQLVDFYSAADVFVNPTYDDNYPTVNIEAISCGTPVVTYKTGGSPESADLFGTSVKRGDIDALIKEIYYWSSVKEEIPSTSIKINDRKDTVKEYIKLYEG